MRSLVRTLADLAAAEPPPAPVPRPVADLLGEGGAAVAAFGRPLMTSGATSGADREELRRVVAASPELSRRALAEVRAGLAGDPETLPACGSLLAEIRRVIHEVDLDGGPHRGAVR